MVSKAHICQVEDYNPCPDTAYISYKHRPVDLSQNEFFQNVLLTQWFNWLSAQSSKNTCMLSASNSTAR